MNHLGQHLYTNCQHKLQLEVPAKGTIYICAGDACVCEPCRAASSYNAALGRVKFLPTKAGVAAAANWNARGMESLRPPELLDYKLLKLSKVQALKSRFQHCTLLQRPAITQRQFSERGMVLEEQALQLSQAAVLQGHHLCVCDGHPCVVINGKVLVEMEQVYQLPIQLPCSTKALIRIQVHVQLGQSSLNEG